ncbi:MAG: hypothetical protein A2Y73_02235 [Chloroflexi bacterium RBG_13_56_8]|nr:MAG: hypothetical protein A2Y73_02235 [Chloroflexi bacterium RBG_13_56_8]
MGDYAQLFESTLQSFEGSAARIWGRDGAFWANDPRVIAEIEDRLGWLDLPTTMPIEVLRLRALADELRAVHMEHVVLLGMGGSSVAPEVMARVLGIAPGYADLAILDTTDPSQIRRVLGERSLSRTLFLVTSKSGTTAETLSLHTYCQWAMREAVGGDGWPEHFIAITDPGTPLEDLARSEGFRALYLNPPDISGRFSALSLFGLVPAAMIGVDLDQLLRRAKEMAWACRPTAPLKVNHGLVLGAIMGELATHPTQPRNKLTLLASPEVAPLGVWVEQLIAESTGKEGRGIVPVVGKPLRHVSHYGADRLFVYLRLEGSDNEGLDTLADGLISAGHPLVALRMTDVYDLGAEFFRWEFATAVAARCLEINPFDQPNVESAKERARDALARYEEERSLPEELPLLRDGSLSLYGPADGSEGASGYLRRFLGQAGKNDYVALMAYVSRNPTNDLLLETIQQTLAERLGLAVTFGYGPRFLHSTGQLHKGGPNSGLYLQITQNEADDLAIPGRAYTFGVLKRAQALGDWQALQEAGRRVVRVNIGADVEAGLEELAQVITEALQPSGL